MLSIYDVCLMMMNHQSDRHLMNYLHQNRLMNE